MNDVKLEIDEGDEPESVFIGFKLGGGIFILAEKEAPVTAELRDG